MNSSSSPRTSRGLRAFVWPVVGLVILAVAVQQVFFPAIWFDRDELQGIRLGMRKEEVLDALTKNGIEHVLPRVLGEIAINRRNIDQIGKLQNAYGICVTSYSRGISAKVTLDSSGLVNQVAYGSVRYFTDLSEARTRSELISRLKAMIEADDSIEAFACIPSAKWVRIGGGADDEEKLLLQYDSWAVDIPESYSGAKFEFEEGHLKKIRFRWQLFETA